MADLSVQDLNKKYRQAKNSRQEMEADWFLNLSYFAGDQWVFWNHGRIDRPELPDWRITLTDNRILPIATSRVAKKIKNRPAFTCIPFSYDDEDMNAAEVGEKVLENDWNKLGLHHKLLLVQLWTEICGAGFWKIYWDSTKGKSENYVMQGDGEPYRNDNGLVSAGQVQELGLQDLLDQGQLNTKPIAQGNVCVDVLSPFEMFPDPLATTADEAEWWIEEKVRSLPYVKEKYNVDAKADSTSSTGVAESRFAGRQLSTGDSDYQGVKVREFYAHDSKEYPGGIWIVWLNDKIVRKKTLVESPYVKCPYVMFTSQVIPGRFWPTSVTTQLRGPQTDLNKVKSQIRENAVRIGNAAVLKSRQANVEMAGLPGEEIWYDDLMPNARPEYLIPPPLPGYVLQEVDRIQESITEISGVHDVSKAMVPTGVTAASAINLLQEADDTRLGPEISGMERTLSEGADIILKLRAKFNDQMDIIQIVGEDGDVDIQEYKNTMLKDNTNVETQAGSTMPRSKAAQQAAMTELLDRSLQYGLQPDPRVLRKFLRDYQMGSLEKLFADLEPDELQVIREHRQLLKGIAIPINDWDDDDYHVASHEEKMKSSKFAKLDEQEQKPLIVHNNAHKERRVQMIQAQMMNGDQAMVGGPQPPGPEVTVEQTNQ